MDDPADRRAQPHNTQDQGIRIEPWMMDELGLGGLPLLLYARIHQAGDEGLTLSYDSLAREVRSSTRHVARVLRTMEAGGLICTFPQEQPNKPHTWVCARFAQAPDRPHMRSEGE